MSRDRPRTVVAEGCWRTALEVTKLLLSLSPGADPLGALLCIDYYALRAHEHLWLLQLFDAWEPTRNLSLLPNFAYSVAMAHFIATDGSRTPRRPAQRDAAAAAVPVPQDRAAHAASADRLLQKALITYPGIVKPLVERCGAGPSLVAAARHAYFASEACFDQPAASDASFLVPLMALYVERSHSLWRTPAVRCVHAPRLIRTRPSAAC